LHPEERCKIEVLHQSGMNAANIGIQLGRHKSTITRELARNSINGSYEYNEAIRLAHSRRSGVGAKLRLSDDHWTYVRVLLYLKWSPEQISGWLRKNPGIGFYVSDQWIYEYIHKNQADGGDLYENLRRKGRPYRNGKFRPYRGKIKDRVRNVNEITSHFSISDHALLGCIL
jgi:IS30 family transposase